MNSPMKFQSSSQQYYVPHPAASCAAIQAEAIWECHSSNRLTDNVPILLRATEEPHLVGKFGY